MADLKPTGRNILRNTQTLGSGWKIPSGGTKSTVIDGFNVYVGNYSDMPSGAYRDCIYRDALEPLQNVEYTLSFWGKGNGIIQCYLYPSAIVKAVNSQGITVTWGSSGGDGRIPFTLTDQWQKYWVTWTTSKVVAGKKNVIVCRQESNVTGHATEASIYGPKLELGSKATNWTPAPEDSLSGGGTNMILAFDVITLATVTDVQGIYRFYQLATSKPSKPTTYPPASAWSDEMPGYQLGNQDSLYFVDVTVFNDLTYQYGEVQLSTDYEAVKATYADALQQIANAEKKMQSDIQKTSESIRMEVSEDYYKKDQTDDLLGTISTALDQTKDSFMMQFNSFQADLENVNADNSAKFQELYQYIRFKGGSIELGESGNTITLTIENDRISFKQAGQEIAYMSNNQLYITDANIVTSLRIGNFIFSPRPNGSLDFKKVGA